MLGNFLSRKDEQESGLPSVDDGDATGRKINRKAVSF